MMNYSRRLLFGSLLCLLPLVVSPGVFAQGDAIDAYIRAEMDKRRIPGLALVVIQRGTVIKMQGYGVANLEHDVPVTPDTVFELASVTKQFTAAGIMLLLEEGKLGLDDPIGRHLTGTPDTWSGITVRHLLTHTAGLATLAQGFRSLYVGGVNRRRRCSMRPRKTRSASHPGSATSTATSATSSSA